MQILSCPRCSIPLGETDESGNLDAVCARCCYHYRVLTARLASTSKDDIGFRVDLDVLGEKRHAVRYRSKRIHLWAKRLIGHWVALLVTLRHGEIEDVVWMWASGEPAVRMGFPGQRARRIALIGAISVLFLVFMFGGFTLATWLTAVLSGGAAYWGISQLRSARVRIGAGDRARISGIQSLLERKLEFARARLHAESEVTRKRDLAQRLTNLVRTMEALDDNLYAGRIERLKRGTRVLVEQGEKERQLAGEYGRAINMTDIEIESRRVAEAWGAQVPEITVGYDGLDALKEEIKQLDVELAANEEVEEALGRSPDTPQREPPEAKGEDMPPIPLERVFDDLNERRSWDQPDVVREDEEPR